MAINKHFQLFLTGGDVMPESVGKKSAFENELDWSGLEKCKIVIS